MKLRQGRSVFRTLYIQQGDDASKADKLIGLVDTPELAAQIVEAVNEREALMALENAARAYSIVDSDDNEGRLRLALAALDQLRREAGAPTWVDAAYAEAMLAIARAGRRR